MSIFQPAGHQHFDAKIDKIYSVFDANNTEFFRVFFSNSNYFEDIQADIFVMWKTATGNYQDEY